jgi:NAD+ kinase
MRVALLGLRSRAEAVSAARETTTWLRQRGVTVAEGDLDAPASVTAAVAEATVVCVFGGDGTMLRAARLVAPHGAGLLGVNLGRLGFLTNASIRELPAILEDVLAGRYSIEERMLLESTHRRRGRELERALALNDVVVARGNAVRSIHVGVHIDGEEFTTYWADGVIVATATGSTAYGFSVGGPVVIPRARTMLFVPIAPHLSFRNAVVLDEGQRLRLVVQDTPSRLSVDGQLERDLEAGDVVDVAPASVNARFVRTAAVRPFLSLLREKILKEGKGI